LGFFHGTPNYKYAAPTALENFSLAEAADNSPQFQLRVGVPTPVKPRRGDRKPVGNTRAIFCRPSGTHFILLVEPAVETAGYFHTSPCDFFAPPALFQPGNGQKGLNWGWKRPF
jgi:hypothetical protein